MVLIHTGWIGTEKPPYISHCIETIQQRSGVDVNVVDDSTVAQYVEGLLHPAWATLPKIAQRMDCIRIALLAQYGGMWCDADTIWLAPIADLLKSILDAEYDLAYLTWDDGRIINGYIIARQGSLVIRHWLAQINILLQHVDDSVSNRWTLFGEQIITPLIRKAGNLYKCLQLARTIFIPLNFDRQARQFFAQSHTLSSYITPQTKAFALNHSWFCDWDRTNFVRQSLAEICQRTDLLGQLFAYSLSFGARNAKA